MLPYDHSNKASSLQLWHSAAGYMWQALIEMFGSQAAQLASRLGSAMPRRPSLPSPSHEVRSHAVHAFSFHVVHGSWL